MHHSGITNVYPPSASSFSPSESLLITISFSDSLYTVGGVSITSATPTLVADAFYLLGYNSPHIAPLSAVAASLDARNWTVSLAGWEYGLWN